MLAAPFTWFALAIAFGAGAEIQAGETPAPIPAPTLAPILHQENAAVADRRATDLEAVHGVLTTLGPRVVIDWVRGNRFGRLTVEVDGRLKSILGPPNPKLVTAASVLHDLDALGVTAEAFDARLAATAPPEREAIVIRRQDVDPSGAGTGPGAGGEGGDGAVRSLVSGRVTQLATTRKGCAEVQVTSVEGTSMDRSTL